MLRYLLQQIKLAFTCWFFFLIPFTNIATIIYSKVRYDICQKENVNRHRMFPFWCVYLTILTFIFKCQNFRSKGRTLGFCTSPCYLWTDHRAAYKSAYKKNGKTECSRLSLLALNDYVSALTESLGQCHTETALSHILQFFPKQYRFVLLLKMKLYSMAELPSVHSTATIFYIIQWFAFFQEIQHW